MGVTRALEPFAGRVAARLALIGACSAIAGLLEGIALVAVVAIAAGAASPGEAEEVSLPLFDIGLGVGDALLLAAVMATVMTLLHVAVGLLTARLSAEVGEQSRNRVLRAFLRAKWEAQSQRSEGFLQEGLSTLTLQTSSLTVYLGNAIAAGLSLGALLLASMFVDIVATFAVLAFGLVSVALIRPVTSRIRRNAERFVATNSELEERATQVARLALEIRAFGVGEEILEDMRGTNRRVADVMRAMRFTSRVGSTIYRDLAILFLIGGVAVLTRFGAEQAVSIGAVIILVVRALAYATTLQSSRQQVAEMAPSLSELEFRLGELDRDAQHAGGRRATRIGDISVEGVSYVYPDGRVAISDASLDIAHGSVVGIVGPSGGGKTTLIQLLLRLRAPTSGRIVVDGFDYREFDDASWSSRVSLVPQESQLIAGTVAENVRFHRERLGDDDLLEAVDLAGLSGDLQSTARGLETMLGPRGAGLSGGQRQRVAIARALATRPDVLVLDEPTSALDADTEATIRRTIEGLKGSVTVIIAAHRPETLKVCDRLVHVENGIVRVVDQDAQRRA